MEQFTQTPISHQNKWNVVSRSAYLPQIARAQMTLHKIMRWADWYIRRNNNIKSAQLHIPGAQLHLCENHQRSLISFLSHKCIEEWISYDVFHILYPNKIWNTLSYWFFNNSVWIIKKNQLTLKHMVYYIIWKKLHVIEILNCEEKIY